MITSVELRELAVERPQRSNTPKRSRGGKWSRYAVPGLILLGFAAAFSWSLRESLARRMPVTVVPVLAIRSEIQAANTPLFRAAGWVEPRPTPVIVSALTEGIVERLLVVEGQEIQAGAPVAELIRADAEISVRQGQAELELRQSELESAQAGLRAAQTYFEEPIERLALVAEAESQLAAIQTELNRLPALVAAAQAKLLLAEKELESRTRSREAVAAISVSKAESEVVIAQANLQELTANQESLAGQSVALTKRRDVLRRQLEIKVEEQRQLAESKAAVSSSKAQVELAAAKLAEAELRLSRTRVTAPSSGKVLSLVARPGTKLMGFAPGALQDASTVITMYDPAMLQIRADVRLENVPLVSFGQTVEIATPAVPGTMHGKVLAVTSITDIQKNTLQVKVVVENPPPVLKPDMLVEAVFLAPPVETASIGDPPLRLMVPRELIDSSGSEDMLWLADRQTGVARRRVVSIGQAAQGGLVEVTAGVSVGDRVIASGRELLVEGVKLNVREVDVHADMKHSQNAAEPAGKVERLPTQ